MARPDPAPALPEQPLISHLVELRTRLLRCVVLITLIAAALYPFANDLYNLLAQPLLEHLPKGGTLIATEVASPFLAPFKLTIVAAVIAAMPFLLHQIWAFVAPGLYRHERRFLFPLLASSVLLFYLGIVFAYLLVLPLIFGFFTSVTPQGVAVMTDINKYLDFVLKMFFAFGLTFEVPVAVVLLVRAGMTTPEQLVAIRPYYIVGAFVAGMLLTPPDVFSQTLLAVPLCLLFEVGVILARFAVKKPAEDEEAAEVRGEH